jgi:hypothetical protein
MTSIFRRRLDMHEEILNLIKKSTTSSGISSVDERTIIQYLCSIAEPEAYTILETMVGIRSNSSLSIAKRVLKDKKFIEIFFRNGLVKADASTIRLWLEFAIHTLGEKAVIRVVYEHKKIDRSLVEKSLYWLPSLISENKRDLLVPLIDFVEQTKNLPVE